MNDLRDLFIRELHVCYDAEHQLSKALPRLMQNATAPQLRRAFDEHLQQTRQHISRLESIFDHLNVNASGTDCPGMEGIIEEGKDMMDLDAEAAVQDAALIAAAQRVEHYEISMYGTLSTWADQLGLEDVYELLQETLHEEKQTDKLLTSLAEGGINEEASERGEERRAA